MAEPALHAPHAGVPPPADGPMAAPADPMTEALAELRALGAAQHQPLRYGHLQALAHRSRAHRGTTRQLLDTRFRRAVADCRALLGGPAADEAASVPVAMPPASRPSCRPANLPASPSADPAADPPADPSANPLADLLEALQAGPQGPAAPPGQTLAHPARAPQDLKALALFRGSWARLRLDQQLDRSLARVPDNAGPLNTQRLLLQALGVMRALSPDYLQHLMAQVEALRWIEQATLADAAAPAPARRRPAERPRRPPRA